MPNSRSPRQDRIPVIDLFAGPGGLGEGFSALEDEQIHFDVVLSVEKDPAAHRTLLLRSFFRQFCGARLPTEYYQYLRGDLSVNALFAAFPEEAGQATSRCLHLQMGPQTTKRVYGQLKQAVGDVKH